PAGISRPMTSRESRRSQSPSFRRRPLTAAEVLSGGGSLSTEDEALRRLMKTPRVFQRAKVIQHNRRGELRANLLPSILQTPSDAAAAHFGAGGPALGGERSETPTQSGEA
ncbi:unnamed protein product, partial [Polarella glacialis]